MSFNLHAALNGKFISNALYLQSSQVECLTGIVGCYGRQVRQRRRRRQNKPYGWQLPRPNVSWFGIHFIMVFDPFYVMVDILKAFVTFWRGLELANFKSRHL